MEEINKPSTSSSSNPTSLETCITTLKEATEELKLLETIYNLPHIETNFDYKTLEEKFGDNLAPKNSLYNTEKYEETIRKEQAEKFQIDRTFLEVVIEEGIGEILNSRSVECMKRRLADCKRERDEEESLLRETVEMVGEIEKLEREVEHSEIQGYMVVKENDELIGKYKDKYEDLMNESQIKLDYIEKWESSRLEQFETRMAQTERDEEDKVRQNKNKLEREARIHAEILAYMNVVIDDHEEAIRYWKEKYETDLKKMDGKINELKTKRITLKMKTTALTVLFNERQNEMRAYEELKEERRLKAEAEARLHAKATKIQAWWRGVMVRRKLGPYKVKKPKTKSRGKSAKR